MIKLTEEDLGETLCEVTERKKPDEALFGMFIELAGTISVMRAIENKRDDRFDETHMKSLNEAYIEAAQKLIEKMNPYLLDMEGE